ncbi:MAG TPA: histidine phosphatase family protein [Vicinamibacteria bacterium]|nr:histidine phosphatase family protein [Vicinamibacteria bacterium]
MTDAKAFELYLVRHGVTDWNEDGRLMGRSDIGLNARGRAQADRAAEALVSRSIEAVYSSPQPRARQTAEPIARAHRLEVQVEPAFDEVWLDAAWMGKTLAELRDDEDLVRLVENPAYECDAIEALSAVRERTVGEVERLGERGFGSVVVVSHGDPLRVIVAAYLGLELSAIRRFSIDNGSISLIRFGRRGPRLVFLNAQV